MNIQTWNGAIKGFASLRTSKSTVALPVGRSALHKMQIYK